MGWLVFMVWVTSWADKRKDYFNYFGKGEEISRHWAAAHFSAFHGAGGHRGVAYHGDGLQWVHMRLMVCTSCLVTQWCPTLWPHGLQPARLLHPWDFPGKNTRGGCHALLQGIFPIQGSNSGLPHCRQILYREAQGSRSSGSQLIYRFGPIWVLIRLCHVLGPCHSFKGCALPSSLMFQNHVPHDRVWGNSDREGNWGQRNQGCEVKTAGPGLHSLCV